MYDCTPPTCVGPVEARRGPLDPLELELEKFVTHRVDSGT